MFDYLVTALLKGYNEFFITRLTHKERRGNKGKKRPCMKENKIRINNYLLRSREGVLSGNGNGQQVLVRVDDRVGDRSDGGVTDLEGDGGNVLDTGNEVTDESILLDVQDGGVEDGTLVVNLDNGQTVGEGRDVQHVQESSLGSSDTDILLDQMDIVDDLNGTTGNLGGDTQSLEEGGLTGLHTGVTGRDVHINGGHGTSLGGGLDTVGENLVTDGLQVRVGEDETDVAADRGHKLLVVGVLGLENTDGTTDHGVLAHKDLGITTESLTDLVHLVGTDIVNVDNEDGVELLQVRLELFEVFLLLACLRHDDSCSRDLKVYSRLRYNRLSVSFRLTTMIVGSFLSVKQNIPSLPSLSVLADMLSSDCGGALMVR